MYNIQNIISESINVKQQIFNDNYLIERIDAAAVMCVDSLKHQGKIHFCGNGGSAADAQHLAAELSGRFYYDRPPLNAEALHVNTSYLTAVGNDYSFDEIYAIVLKGTAHGGDVLFAISTSGNSKNILKAIETAKQLNVKVVGMTGASGGLMKDCCDVLLNVPSSCTPRIQEAHIMIGQIIESIIFPR